MITHQMNVVKEICDHIAVIEGGKIIEQGTMFDIFTNPQNPTTKEFVATTQHEELPDIIARLPLKKNYEPGDDAYVRLHFIGESAKEPVIATLIKKYDINVNIIAGNLESLQEIPYGTLLIGMDADEAHMKKAMDYLHENKLQIEVIGYVR